MHVIIEYKPWRAYNNLGDIKKKNVNARLNGRGIIVHQLFSLTFTDHLVSFSICATSSFLPFPLSFHPWHLSSFHPCRQFESFSFSKCFGWRVTGVRVNLVFFVCEGCRGGRSSGCRCTGTQTLSKRRDPSTSEVRRQFLPGLVSPVQSLTGSTQGSTTHCWFLSRWKSQVWPGSYPNSSSLFSDHVVIRLFTNSHLMRLPVCWFPARLKVSRHLIFSFH